MENSELKERDVVSLAINLPRLKLNRDQTGTVVRVYGCLACEVKFSNGVVVMLSPADLVPVKS